MWNCGNQVKKRYLKGVSVLFTVKEWVLRAGRRLYLVLVISVGLHLAMLAISLHQNGLYLTGERHFVGLVTQNARTFAPADPAGSTLAATPKTVGNVGAQPVRTSRRREILSKVEPEPDQTASVTTQEILLQKKQTLTIADKAHDTGLLGGRPEINDLPLKALPPVAGGGMSSGTAVVSKKNRPAATPPVIRTTRAKPRYADNPSPVYPAVARRKGWSGKVLLLVQVDKAGAVKRLSVKRSSGYRVLDRAARRAVRRWRFVPATEVGRRVVSEVVVPIDFRLPINDETTPLPLSSALK